MLSSFNNGLVKINTRALDLRKKTKLKLINIFLPPIIYPIKKSIRQFIKLFASNKSRLIKKICNKIQLANKISK